MGSLDYQGCRVVGVIDLLKTIAYWFIKAVDLLWIWIFITKESRIISIIRLIRIIRITRVKGLLDVYGYQDYEGYQG